jgi:hypothetical protein
VNLPRNSLALLPQISDGGGINSARGDAANIAPEPNLDHEVTMNKARALIAQESRAFNLFMDAIEAAGKVEAEIFAVAQKQGSFDAVKPVHAALNVLVEKIEALAHGK